MTPTAALLRIWLLLLPASFVQAQSTAAEKKHQLKLSPLRLLDPVNPGMELSFQTPSFRRGATQLSYTYLVGFFLNRSDPSATLNGHRLALEQKWMLQQRTNKRLYGSVELVYLTAYYPSTLWIEPRAGSVSGSRFPYRDTIHISRKTFSLNVRTGYEFFFSKRFVLDVAIGFGIKYRIVRHFDRLDPNDTVSKPKWINFYAAAENEGQEFTANLPFTCKIGYRF